MMNLRIIISLVLTIFGSFCQLAPATSPKHYELGTTYSYQYSAVMLLNEPRPVTITSNRSLGTDVGYKIAAVIDLTSVWQDPSDADHILLELLVQSPKLSIHSRKAPSSDGFTIHSSPLDDVTETLPMYLDWKNGKVSRIFVAETESAAFLNLKKGVASLFQVRAVPEESQEVDASGLCSVSYQQREDSTFFKKKNDCSVVRPNKSGSFSRAQKILGISSSTENQWKYSFKSGVNVLEVLTATEVQNLRVTLRSQAGASITSRQFLHLSDESRTDRQFPASSLEEAIQSVAKSCGTQLTEDVLQIAEEPVNQCQGSSCQTLAKAVGHVRSSLQSSKLASSVAAEAFLRLVPVARRSSKDEIVPVLTDSKNKKILPQLLDVVAAAQTLEAHQAALEVLDFKAKNIDLAERYLVAMSLSTHPSEFLVKDLLTLCRKKLPNDKLVQTALLTLAAVTRTFGSNTQNGAGSEETETVVQEVRQFLLDSLAGCRDEACCQLYLRSLKNLARADTMPIILEHLDATDKKTSVTAMKALRALPAQVFDAAVKKKLESIYFQIGRRYDSSARTLALDVLLEHEPSDQFLFDALRSLSSKEAKELSTYTLQRLTEFADNNPTIHSQLKQILVANPSLNNYHVLAQDGLSTAFSRIMYRDVNGAGTFSSSNEVVNGVMKRSAFDIFLTNSEDSLQLLSFGLFTGGLSSLMGGSSDGDDEDATAGMEITLTDVQLRPLVFFEGQGELMGHVWSGTASERTSALQATVLLQDHQQTILLQSGFVALFNVMGSVSFDFGGEIQISIWNRNSHSVVDNMAAWDVEGSLSLSTPFVNSGVEFKVGAQAKIDFVSDVNFSGDFLACLRMGQNGFKLNHVVQKRENIPGTKHRIHKRKTRQESVPGRTYVLNAKNSVLCNEMFP